MTFTTSLTVSPHKNSRLLLSIGKTHPNFEPYDFKKRDGFLRSLKLSRQLDLYRQNYCGCEFSRNALPSNRTTQNESDVPNPATPPPDG